uniref:C2 domain containing 3 centriole elongation regulator n=1 Tax=Varanus komodoensis TaxID=61221 RepID=A0A8D2ITF3_VARKO
MVREAGLGAVGGRLSDISPSTSLPPLVEGQLRCFLKMTVNKILWTIAKPPASVLIRVRWWGETSDGTVFVPRDTSQAEQKALKTTTRYPIRCGPKQFASYLTDMGTLILEVMTKSDHLPIGRTQLSGLAQLSPSHPLSGFFTIVSPTSEKMGELQVSLVLEPLSETFGSSNSIPNADVSFSAGLSAQGAKEVAKSGQHIAPSPLHQPPGTSVIGGESWNGSRASTPRGKDHLYFQENSENIREGFFGPQQHLILGQNDPLKASAPKQQEWFPRNSDDEAQVKSAGGSPRPVRVLSCNAPATKDLLSALLDQGHRLREAMVVSAMKSSLDLNAAHPPAENLKNLTTGLVSTAEEPLQPQDDCSQFDLHSEDRAIQLLLGSADFSPVRHVDGTGSPPESVSLGSEVYDSELNDPHYDQSLLENLFYTARKSDSSLSDFLSEEEDGVPSGKLNRSQYSKLQKSPKALESSSLDQKGKGVETKFRPLPLHETSMESAGENQAVNLSLDRLTVLGRIRLARAVVENLKIPPEDPTPSTPGKKSCTGKPPRPALPKKRTYFVEYHFPVAASKTGTGQVAITTETVRVASSKTAGEVVKFQQRYVFPIHFGGLMITHWWDSDLEFNIYVKKGAQRKPLLVGSGALPLRDVIQSEQLMVSCALPVKEDGAPARLGPLKVSLELAADNKDFSSINARAGNLAQQAPVYTARSPGVTLPAADRRTAPAESPWLPKEGNCPSSKRSQESLPADPGQLRVDIGQPHVPTPASRNLLNQLSACEEEGLLLHVLLMVPEGQVSVPRDAGRHGSCNLYLNCKLFSTEEATRSAVVWGTTQPKFHFSQVTPISLTPKHLERLKNNVMVIEAWNKVHSPRGDRLLGLVKLPLHQFYVSFKDPKISGLLLQAQYPVLAVDGSVPVVDVFTGNQSGSLKVILAMGSADQIVALQRLKNEEGVVPPVVLRPPHSLDSLAPADREREGLMEHIFEIRIESVKGLTPLQSTVWGEADCYVQYHFPVQKLESDMLHGNALHERGLELQPFRSATTLCVPDPAFDDVRLHSLSLPADAPVQRLLLSAFSAQGLAGGGGVQFEIWCRYYYPNVREQMVARGTLPLSRLCAMVTMRHREEVGLQTFSLPLIPRTEGSGELQPRSSGLLDVSIKYRRSPKVTKGVLAAQVVSISVQIHSAAGLQAAARALVENNPSLQYSAEVGVNAYVSVQVPFLPKAERRLTRAVARTFCPEFEHHTEFPCNLMVQRSSGETCCLGELLQLSEIVFSIFHKNLSAGIASISTSLPDFVDELLGTARVPTRDLLTKRSGIRGWYPVTLPEDLVSSRCENVLQTVVGGLEVSVTFAHSEDRERVLDAAKLLGWNWEESCTEGLQDDDEDGGQPARKLAVVTVSIPCLWLPLKCVLLAGQTHLNKRVYCYLRYKLYDQEATWTSLRRPKLAEDQNHVTVTFKKSKQMDLPWSQMLLWYFREERLEVQVWRAYGNEGSTERPLETDRLIGSAYVDLAGLGGSSRRKQTVSGVFPLFRRNAANLLGAAARVHITVASSSPHAPELAEDGSSGGGSEILHERSPEVPPPPEDPGKTFAVSILVERAMHLSLKGSPLTERGVMSPSSYVSFVTADADLPVTTEVVENTDSPVWDFQQQTRLSKELLLDPQQTLVFKVWHKADVERVIGFASVDLSPLLSGFQVVCGWYNITDFSGQCQGQIKVAVSPLESILHLKEERQARSRTKAPGSAVRNSFPCGAVTFLQHAKRQHPGTGKSEFPFSSCVFLRRTGSSRPWMPRHEEHVQNIRQFHESLQQAEGTTSQVGRLDSLSHSSRNSLLRTLRKNLSELDEIQRYFHQKLTKPYPDVGPSGRNLDDPGARTVDPTGRHLLAKSNHLVSQVSSLLVGELNYLRGGGGRQRSVPFLRGPAGSKVSQAEPRKEPARACVDQGPLCPLVNSPCGRGEPYEFLGQGDSPSGPPSPTHCHQQAEDTAESHSEGEYDEDIIEPRTLNEITVVTDKTSPWSSVLSEPEGDQEAEVARGTEPPEGSLEEGSARSSPLPSVPLRPGHGGGGSATPEAVAPETEEGRGASLGTSQAEEETSSRGERHQPCPEFLDAAQQNGSCPDESHRDPPAESDELSNAPSPAQPPLLQGAQVEPWLSLSNLRSGRSISSLTRPLRSDPVVVPNFFLPPQHLEASMRMLSVSSASLATDRKPEGRAVPRVTLGLPRYAKPARQRPYLAGPCPSSNSAVASQQPGAQCQVQDFAPREHLLKATPRRWL